MRTILVLAIIICVLFLIQPHRARWQNEAVPGEPVQTNTNLPHPWNYKDYLIIPKAKYHIKAVVLAKRSYWGGEAEDKISPYDLALGWGAMSDAKVINQLKTSLGWRWFNYKWENAPPISFDEINSHSSNNHIVPANKDVLQQIKRIKQYDVVELDGYLISIQSPRDGWHWDSSLSRTDREGGACELIWVTQCSISQ